jgi:hypothetical protein
VAGIRRPLQRFSTVWQLALDSLLARRFFDIGASTPASFGLDGVHFGHEEVHIAILA